MASVCPFAKASRPDDACPRKSGGTHNSNQAEHEGKVKESTDSGIVSPKCPFGYDTHTFKIGPLSCIICQALLYESSKCVPCSHKYCKACISRFKDCPLCGADIEKIEADTDLQDMVDRFIEGHARIKRPDVKTEAGELRIENKTIIYEDVSLERGAFLLQQAMRAFHGKNIESAKSRLILCAEDIREQLERLGNTAELCSQLGAVLGMLGDCCRATGDAHSAVTYYEESVDFLLKLPKDDLEVIHTLSVSLNKIGDLKYYDGDLQAARSYYSRSLDIRRNAIKDLSSVPSQLLNIDRMDAILTKMSGLYLAKLIDCPSNRKSSKTLDVAVSLAKVADVDRGIGNEEVAVEGFQEAIKCLESLSLNSDETGLEQRRRSVLEFLNNQLAETSSAPTV